MKKESKLSQELKKVRKKLKEAEFTKKEIDFIMVQILLMNKEFIKKIKEGCCTFVSAGAVCSVIDNITGDDLK